MGQASNINNKKMMITKTISQYLTYVDMLLCFSTLLSSLIIDNNAYLIRLLQGLSAVVYVKLLVVKKKRAVVL